MFLRTLSKPKTKAGRWDKMLGQISIGNEDHRFLIHEEMDNLLTETKEALLDINNSTAGIMKSLKVSEALTITFGLGRIHENLFSIPHLMITMRSAKDEFAPTVSGANFKASSDNRQNILGNAFVGGRDGLRSYPFALGRTIDASLPNGHAEQSYTSACVCRV